MNLQNLLLFALLFLLIGCEKNESPDHPSEIVPLNLEGLTWSHVKTDQYGNLHIDSVIVQYNEILGYDSTKHTFLIDNEAGEKIRAVLSPVSGVRFIVALDSTMIYEAHFIPRYSSMHWPNDICVEPYSYDNKYQIKLGYPSSMNYEGEDPRNDYRIISRLFEDNKLIEID